MLAQNKEIRIDDFDVLAEQVYSSPRSTLGAKPVNPAVDLTPDLQNGAALYDKQCANCHEATAWGDGVQAIPALAGQRESYLLAQLIEFARRHRISPEMQSVLSDTQLARPQIWRDLAAYLNTQAPNRQAKHGDGQSLHLGECAYQKACAQCHGRKGEGSAEEPIPALRAQHYSYLVLQLSNFATGHRSDVEPPVIDFVAGLSGEDIAGIADYLSRIPAKKQKAAAE